MAPLDLFNRLKVLYSKDERESTLHWLTGFDPETLPTQPVASPQSHHSDQQFNVCELFG